MVCLNLIQCISTGPSLEHFIANSGKQTSTKVKDGKLQVPYLKDEDMVGNGRSGKLIFTYLSIEDFFE